MESLEFLFSFLCPHVHACPQLAFGTCDQHDIVANHNEEEHRTDTRRLRWKAALLTHNIKKDLSRYISL